MSKTADAVTVVIPVHNAADRVDKIAGWRLALEKCGRRFEIIVVDDGSTDGTAERMIAREPGVKVLKHATATGFGACLRTALAEAEHPLFFYTALDYPYTPSDIRTLLDRINLRDEILGKQPDIISGCRMGQPVPGTVKAIGWMWGGFWRVFAGMPMAEPAPWHGWGEYWYGVRASWVFGVPFYDVNSCFKLCRTDFLKRFPIQSDGDFVHTEIAAKATFLTSVMDEVPLTPKPDPVPALGSVSADRRRVFRDPQFRFADTPSTPGANTPASPDAPGASTPGSPISPAPAT